MKRYKSELDEVYFIIKTKKTISFSNHCFILLKYKIKKYMIPKIITELCFGQDYAYSYAYGYGYDYAYSYAYGYGYDYAQNLFKMKSFFLIKLKLNVDRKNKNYTALNVINQSSTRYIL